MSTTANGQVGATNGSKSAVQEKLPSQVEEKIEAFIDIEAEKAVREEINEHKQLIFAELNQLKKEFEDEIDGHFQRMGMPYYGRPEDSPDKDDRSSMN